MTAYSDSSNGAELSVQDFFSHVRRVVDVRLDQFVPSATTSPSTIHSAIRWSLLGAGKRLRPALVMAVGRTFGGLQEDLLDVACAFEMVHTYSLIHDDLPAMDDDDLRRGRPTCHVKFGEASAILAGDALQTLAFQIIAEAERLAPSLRIRIVGELSRAAGTPFGMVAGQVYDLDAESSEVSGEELEKIHAHKTGALIVAAARCGAIIAGAADSELEDITKFSSSLGLLFQITDDLLDITATAADLGKTPGKDQRAQKSTYPALFGQEGAQKLAAGTFTDAVNALAHIGCDTTLLHQIASFTLSRRS
jgi:geranylgeranyl diphosphate synthase type II